MKGCVIFDFDGVIADTEHQHFLAYNAALDALAQAIGGPLCVPLDVYERLYIPYGDREGFAHMLADAGRAHTPQLIDRLVATKADLITDLLVSVTEPLPGVRRALDALAAFGTPVAICSSARRAEIEQVLRACGLDGRFDVLVSVDDVSRSKPDPEGYALAFARLQESRPALDIACSMAVEDTGGGARAARDAGLRVLGVATTLPLSEIAAHATWAARSLADVAAHSWPEWLCVDALGFRTQ